MDDKRYISKEEKKIPIEDPSGKWSDLTLLPEWSEEYYDVYTARKFGKWVMLKALKKEYADDPEYRKMLEKEFDVRYNLAHPHIVMVNDFEEVPGVGRAIITDDVYGYSLRRMIDERRLTPKIVKRLQTQLPNAMEYIAENHIEHHPITPDNIVFTEYNENLKLLNVGFAQKKRLTKADEREDIKSYGRVVNEVLDNLPTSMPRLRRIAQKCVSDKKSYNNIADVQLALAKRSTSQLFIIVSVFILLMGALLLWLTLRS